MTYALTLAAVRKLKPCNSAYNRIATILPKRGKIDARQAVEAGCTIDDLVWVASAVARNDKAIERLMRHWLADCATRVLHIYERKYPNDARVRNAITAAHDYADGLIDAAARAAAGAAAGAAARAAARAAAGAASGAAARAAAGDAARAAEEACQLDRLVYWLTDANPQRLELPV